MNVLPILAMQPTWGLPACVMIVFGAANLYAYWIMSRNRTAEPEPTSSEEDLYGPDTTPARLNNFTPNRPLPAARSHGVYLARLAEARPALPLQPDRDGVWTWTDGKHIRLALMMDGKLPECCQAIEGRWAGPFDVLDLDGRLVSEQAPRVLQVFHEEAASLTANLPAD